MNTFLVNILCVSFVSSVLILLVKLLSKLYLKRYGARFMQVIWIIIAIRLVIPISFAEIIELNYQNKTEHKETVETVLPDTYNNQINNVFHTELDYHVPNKGDAMPIMRATSESLNKTDSSNLPSLFIKMRQWSDRIQYELCIHVQWIFVIYLVGVIVFLFVHWVLYVLTCWRVNRNAYKLPTEKYIKLIKAITNDYELSMIPDVYVTDYILSPMIMSVNDTTIYLPKSNYTDDELEAILRHELMHLSHKDLLIKRLYLLANAMHWFNPLCYFMTSEAGRDMELYCDQDVVKYYDIEKRKHYNEILFGFLEDIGGFNVKHRFFTTSYQGDVKEMKTRFYNNLDMKKKKAGIVPLILMFALAICLTAIISFDIQEVVAEKLHNVSIFTQLNYYDKYISEDEEYAGWSVNGQTLLAEQIYDSKSAACDFKPVKSDDGTYIIKVIAESGEDYLYGQKFLVNPEKEAFDEAPEIEIYYNFQRIENYGVISEDTQSEKVEFFKGQLEKYNAVIDVYGWNRNITNRVEVLFSEDMIPDVVQIKDYVLDDEGQSHYAGKYHEMIYHNPEVDQNIKFNIKGHLAYERYEANSALPYYRAIEMKCYWATKKDIHSAIYMFVIGSKNVDDEGY